MIAVVHLVWGPLGPGPLRRFLASYRQFAPGAEHDLVLLLNNVDDARRTELMGELDGIDHRVVELASPVQDLAAYVQAAERLEHERMCFLNSYSEILADDWLGKLDRALDQPDVGLVGATGSWASMHSAVLSAFMLPNPYRGLLPRRRIVREHTHAIELELQRNRVDAGVPGDPGVRGGPGELPPRSLSSSVVKTLRAMRPMPAQLLRYEPFPAYHVRTNAFMLDRATFAELDLRPIVSKEDAYLLESSRESFTSQLRRLGRRTLVVARDGCFYDHPQWPASRTLWQGDQEGLLVADNQTRTYTNGDLQRRRILSTFAWGPQARPTEPR